jgi:dsRNA-specific ribonuclease|tara:strand:- start:1401 stop:2423 length:1023 start_codon:yes stop_codon:yes gene_type:complete
MNTDDDIRVEKNSNGMETYIFDPYNPLNKLISPEQIQEIMARYNVPFTLHNQELYKRAFIHRSYIRRPDIENKTNNIILADKPKDCIGLFTKSNERLEFIGDGVLELITKYYLYRRFPKENEGFMTEKKIALVKNEAIGKMAYEMGLHNWVVLSKHAESKQIRTNLKKLGCLFEAFIGAMFLDFNHISIHDDDKWFDNVFVCGPGFQMVQIFVESVFEKHVDWISLIRNDDNFKNILQVMIQKEFKVTPDYLEVAEHDSEIGYHMGVYLCLGQHVHGLKHCNSVAVSKFKCYTDVHNYMSKYGKVFVFMGEGKHKIKKKAEQFACDEAIRILEQFQSVSM